jgi:peptide/nickel transport system ATP-binding protein/oligopeptide transport system ATP-binding protein
MTQELVHPAAPTPADGRKKLLVVEHLRKHFTVGGGFLRRPALLRAVDDVSFAIVEGETFGLVGESGCGKSTLALTVVRLYEPDGGRIVFDGTDISHLPGGKLRPFRKDIQMIFQDPYSSLDPRMTVGGIIEEPLRNFGVPNRRERVRELLQAVGLNAYFVNRYPHEFSGGQRQRIGIARAIALHPKLIVCDEPVSALDVSIQAQVLNLLRALQRDYGLTYLFIAHNLAVVAHISDRIGVMYLGKLVEIGPTEQITSEPRHPYTRALLSAAPVPQRRLRRERIILRGEVPSPLNPPTGCRFHPRCPIATDRCAVEEPELRLVAPGQFAACHYA